MPQDNPSQTKQQKRCLTAINQYTGENNEQQNQSSAIRKFTRLALKAYYPAIKVLADIATDSYQTTDKILLYAKKTNSDKFPEFCYQLAIEANKTDESLSCYLLRVAAERYANAQDYLDHIVNSSGPATFHTYVLDENYSQLISFIKQNHLNRHTFSNELARDCFSGEKLSVYKTVTEKLKEKTIALQAKPPIVIDEQTEKFRIQIMQQLAKGYDKAIDKADSQTKAQLKTERAGINKDIKSSLKRIKRINARAPASSKENPVKNQQLITEFFKIPPPITLQTSGNRTSYAKPY